MSTIRLSTIASRLSARVPRDTGEPDDKHAAVAVIFRERVPERGPELLFIKRADKETDPWSGHMAFPGGRQDPRDADLLHTALRETREEVGLALGPERLIGRLDAIGAVNRTGRIPLAITPFVFSIGDADPVLVPKLDEVAEVHWTALEPLLRGEAQTTFPFEREGERLEFPAFKVGERIVWGLTYRMLGDLFAAIRET